MSELSKQALKVENNTSFPNNNSGEISAADLRAFNVDMIDSLVDEITYNADSASWNQQITALEQFTSSQQPSFTALNQFTASQLTINSGVNAFTQSANGRLTALENETQNLELFTASVNQIADNGIVQGTSTRLHFSGLVSASIVPNVNGPIASIFIEQDGTKLNSASFNAYTASTDSDLVSIHQTTQSLNVYTASTNSDLNSIHQTTQSLNNFTASLATAFVSTASFNAYTQSNDSKWANLQPFTASLTASVQQLLNLSSSLSGGFVTEGELQAATASLINQINTKLNTSSFNAYTASNDSKVNSLIAATASYANSASVAASQLVQDGRLTNLETTSASVNISISNINSFTSSANQRLTAIESVSGSWITESETGSFARTNAANTFTANQTITGNLTVSGVVSASVIHTIFETASVIYSSGSNQFGDELTDVQTLSGSVLIRGGLVVNNLDVTASLNSLSSKTGSYATTGSNTFVGNQTLTNGANLNVSGNIALTGDTSRINFPNGTYIIGAAGDYFGINSDGESQQFDVGDSAPTPSSQNITFRNTTPGGQIIFRNSNGGIISLSGSATQIQDVSFIPFSQSLDSRINNINVTTASILIETQNLELFTASANSRLNNIEARTGSYATTGSNTFVGDQTLLDAATNFVTLTQVSSSLMLVGKGFTSASAHFLSAPGTGSNIILKQDNNTTTTILSGSYNIIANQGAATAGFQRVLGNQNLSLSNTGVPQVSSSMTSVPWNFFRNVLLGTTSLRGPVSSSTYTIGTNILMGGTFFGPSATLNFERAKSGLAFTQNSVLGQLNYTANTTDIAQVIMSGNTIQGVLNIHAASSSVNFNNTLHNGTTNITSSYVPPAGASGSNAAGVIQGCFFYGNQTNVLLSGSNTLNTVPRQMVHTGFIGSAISASLNGNGDNTHMISTFVAGHSLRVTGSNTAFGVQPTGPIRNDYGSVFLGRFNATDGNRAKTAETVLAVGTGNSGSAKTGFLIDSGSNTFVEGTFNVSGSTTLSGSLYIQSSSVTFPSATGSTLLAWDALTGQVTNTTYQSALPALFDVGAFYSTVTQSGSANVSASFVFDNTVPINSISLTSGSRINIPKNGYYNFQFSIQLDNGASSSDVAVWLKKNGGNVANTATYVTLPSNHKDVLALNLWDSGSAGDYYEIAYQSTTSNTNYAYIAPTGNIPGSPSIILTVNQVR